MCDPILLAMAFDLHKKTVAATYNDRLPMIFSALDMLDYLGAKMDREKAEICETLDQTGSTG